MGYGYSFTHVWILHHLHEIIFDISAVILNNCDYALANMYDFCAFPELKVMHGYLSHLSTLECISVQLRGRSETKLLFKILMWRILVIEVLPYHPLYCHGCNTVESGACTQNVVQPNESYELLCGQVVA